MFLSERIWDHIMQPCRNDCSHKKNLRFWLPQWGPWCGCIWYSNMFYRYVVNIDACKKCIPFLLLIYLKQLHTISVFNHIYSFFYILSDKIFGDQLVYFQHLDFLVKRNYQSERSYSSFYDSLNRQSPNIKVSTINAFSGITIVYS